MTCFPYNVHDGDWWRTKRILIFKHKNFRPSLQTTRIHYLPHAFVGCAKFHCIDSPDKCQRKFQSMLWYEKKRIIFFTNNKHEYGADWWVQPPQILACWLPCRIRSATGRLTISFPTSMQVFPSESLKYIGPKRLLFKRIQWVNAMVSSRIFFTGWHTAMHNCELATWPSFPHCTMDGCGKVTVLEWPFPSIEWAGENFGYGKCASPNFIRIASERSPDPDGDLDSSVGRQLCPLFNFQAWLLPSNYN